MRLKWIALALAAGCAAAPPPAAAEIKIGVNLALTGPAAALGIPVRNGFGFCPAEIAGEKLNFIILDDAGDPGQATTNARRFVTEDKVDILMGSSNTPQSHAIAGIALETGTPQFAFGPMGLPPDRMKWTFVMPQAVSLMAKGVFEHMKKNNITTVGFIGFSDSWGDLWVREFKAQAEPLGLKMVAEERYARADTSVTGQALKLVAAKPDAILVAGSGTGAALPQLAIRERGYAGPMYHTHGIVGPDFLRVAGKSAEGIILPSGPPIVAELQSDGALTKAPGLALVKPYEAKFGPGTRNQFAGHSFDACLVLQRIVPVALKSAKPGSKEFRDALLKATESEKDIAASHGVYNFTPADHSGLDERGRVLLTVKDGAWVLVK